MTCFNLEDFDMLAQQAQNVHLKQGFVNVRITYLPTPTGKANSINKLFVCCLYKQAFLQGSLYVKHI